MSVIGRVVGGALGVVPPRVIRTMATQYAAGATRDDAMRVVAELRGVGALSTVAVLGEAGTTPEYAHAHVCELTGLLEGFERANLTAADVPHLGVKPTALGIELGYDVALSNLTTVADAARAGGSVVEIDMEQSGYVDRTLDLVRDLRNERDNVTAVVQAYLHRTRADVEALVQDRIPARIVKGTYKEGPQTALQLHESIREAFVDTARLFLQNGVFVGIATHDEYVVERVLQVACEVGAAPGSFEFQMIMGIQEPLRDRLLATGHAVRVTVHFGTDMHKWLIRRLRENPEIAKYAAVGMMDALRNHRD